VQLLGYWFVYLYPSSSVTDWNSESAVREDQDYIERSENGDNGDNSESGDSDDNGESSDISHNDDSGDTDDGDDDSEGNFLSFL